MPTRQIYLTLSFKLLDKSHDCFCDPDPEILSNIWYVSILLVLKNSPHEMCKLFHVNCNCLVMLHWGVKPLEMNALLNAIWHEVINKLLHLNLAIPIQIEKNHYLFYLASQLQLFGNLVLALIFLVKLVEPWPFDVNFEVALLDFLSVSLLHFKCNISLII